VVFCLFVVFCTVFAGTKKLTDSLWMVFPLITGVFIALGVMALLDIKLNFFNIVVIPSLLGMGVDHGIHFYRRWKELNKNTPKTRSELYDPLTACTVTTMMGYLGMVFASHYGIQSIGIAAVLGMFCLWITSLFLFPVLLHWRYRRGD
jgi:predicted RND superfamily exporter protein